MLKYAIFLVKMKFQENWKYEIIEIDEATGKKQKNQLSLNFIFFIF